MSATKRATCWLGGMHSAFRRRCHPSPGPRQPSTQEWRAGSRFSLAGERLKPIEWRSRRREMGNREWHEFWRSPASEKAVSKRSERA